MLLNKNLSKIRHFCPLIAFSVWLVPAYSQSSEPVYTDSLLKLILSLLFVIALIGGLAWCYRRLGFMKPLLNSTLRIEQSVSLGHREKIVILRVEQQRYLVGITASNITKLAELAPATDAESTKTNDEPETVQT